MVGINPTRQGNELATDIRHTDCQLIVTEAAFLPLLSGLDIEVDCDRILVVDDASFAERCRPYESAGFPDPELPGDATQLLLFTSGTSGAPKAAIVTQQRIARYGRTLSAGQGLDASSVCCQAMPMFHSTRCSPVGRRGVRRGVDGAAPTLSASGFIDDVRKFRATFFNYVGKPLSYILATPSRPDDRDHSLQRVLGNEGTELDLRRFSERFGVPVADNYGSTEGGVTVMRSPEQTKGVLGKPPDGVFVVDSMTGEPCPLAELDDSGRLLNAEECIGEIVNKNGGASFEGYYKNDEAVALRTRRGGRRGVLLGSGSTTFGYAQVSSRIVLPERCTPCQPTSPGDSACRKARLACFSTTRSALAEGCERVLGNSFPAKTSFARYSHSSTANARN